MYISAKTLDDLLREVFTRLLKSKNRIRPGKGRATELIGVLLELTNPRARLSRTEKKGLPFGCLGEFLWYFAGSDDLSFISYYLPEYKKSSDDGRTIYGAYGPRLFNMNGINQIKNVLARLKSQDTRRAVIQLFKAEDIAKSHKEIPCTCTLQFMIRRRRLHMLTYMRSNDVFLGLPNDVFAFTMMQELVARILKVELGVYKHSVGSLHLYDDHRESAQLFLKEGWQTTKVFMPPMPEESDPYGSLRRLLKAERSIRERGRTNVRNLHPYWEDLIRLLQIYWHSKTNNQHAIGMLKGKMSSAVYDTYIERKKRVAKQKATQIEHKQMLLL